MKLLHLSHNLSDHLFLPSCATFSLAGLGQRQKKTHPFLFFHLLFILSPVCEFLERYIGLGGSRIRSDRAQQRSGAAVESLTDYYRCLVKLLLVIFPSVLLLFLLVVFYAFLRAHQVGTPPLPPPAPPLPYPTAMIPWKGEATPVGSFFFFCIFTNVKLVFPLRLHRCELRDCTAMMRCSCQFI